MDILLYCLIFVVGALTGFFISKKSHTNDYNNLLNLVKQEFSYLATKQLNSEQKEILEQNKSVFNLILEPLNKQIQEFKNEIVQYKDSHIKNTSELNQKITDLTSKSVMLSQSAQDLTNALTQNQNVKGLYGESLAKTILENAGFKEGIHFATQCVEKNEDDKIVRPDFEIFLPDNRTIIVDAKSIFTSIINYNDDEESFKNVLNAVKARIKELSSKKYHTVKNLSQPDFVIMYIPVEPVVNLIYTSKEGLEIVDYARHHNIIVTGSISLVTIVNLIDKIWKENDRIQNLDNIILVGTKLYDAVAKHAQELIKIQKSINEAKDFTDLTISRFFDSDAKMNIFKEAEKLKDYGIVSDKTIENSL